MPFLELTETNTMTIKLITQITEKGEEISIRSSFVYLDKEYDNEHLVKKCEYNDALRKKIISSHAEAFDRTKKQLGIH